jgi:CubicO group peptidase (beta-lactamase class C family)
MHQFPKFLAALCSLSFCLDATAQASAPAWPGPEWQKATPEELGMDSQALATLVEYGSNVQMDSLIVVRHGKVVAEAYYAPFKAGMKHRINSATKGVVAALAGIAAGQGVLGSTDAPVLNFFADRSPANLDARKKAMTLQTLLDMTSGMDWTEPLNAAVPQTLLALQRSADWQQFVLDRPMARAPGSSFNYNSGNSHLVSAILARTTGMNTEDFAAKHLFKPLGITDYRWRQDPQGVSTGGFGLYLQTPDMARIGYLYLHHGAWNGTQIVPREWVGKVYRASVPMWTTGSWRYGDFWWTLPERKAYMAVGYNRQIIMVLADIGVVAAMTGRNHYPIENVIDHLTGAVKSERAMEANPQALALLREKIKEAATEKASAIVSRTPALAREISGKTFRLEGDNWGWKELRLHLGDAPSYEVVSHPARESQAATQVTGPLGMDGRFAIIESPDGTVVASKAAWLDDSTLMVTVRLPEEASTLTYQLRFNEGRLQITQTNAFGQQRTATAEMQP